MSPLPSRAERARSQRLSEERVGRWLNPNPLSELNIMKKIFALAATAMLLTTASSAFAGEQRVKVRGRTDVAVHADIVSAATTICRQELGKHAGDLLGFCVQDITYNTVKKVGSPTLTAYSKTQRRAIGLQLASY